jgi:hypothetical protein
MRRAFGSAKDGVSVFLRLQREAEGLKMLLRQLPSGSTLDDARRLRERIMQMGRTPCSFLDSDLGVARDR